MNHLDGTTASCAYTVFLYRIFCIKTRCAMRSSWIIMTRIVFYQSLEKTIINTRRELHCCLHNVVFLNCTTGQKYSSKILKTLQMLRCEKIFLADGLVIQL